MEVVEELHSAARWDNGASNQQLFGFLGFICSILKKILTELADKAKQESLSLWFWRSDEERGGHGRQTSKLLHHRHTAPPLTDLLICAECCTKPPHIPKVLQLGLRHWQSE